MASKRNNRPSHKRDPKPPALQLTARDLEILRNVNRYRVLNAHQIEVLNFPPASEESRSLRSACQRRLQKLYHHKYLDRILLPLVPGEGRRPYPYALDKRGADELAQHVGVDRGELGWKPRANRLGPIFLEHLLAISQFRVTAELQVRSGAWQSVDWVDEIQLRKPENQHKVPRHNRRGKAVVRYPDGYFTVTLHGVQQPAHFFLEVDQGTEKNQTWADKMKAYMEFRSSGQSSAQLGTANFRVVALVSSQRRLENLMRVTAEAGAVGHYWFALQSQIDIWKPNSLLQPIWLATGIEGRQPLFAT